ncbi:MAG TPA: hypothetical protein PLA94_32840, partial [Myxococcota bacterium]|nr:hypothetical protein [Myxococcota bacterium]
DLDPLYRGYGKQEALRRQTELFAADPQVEQRWLAYLGDFKDRGNFVRNAAEPFGDAKVAGHDGSDLALQRGKDGEALHKKWRSHRSRYSGFSDPAHPFRHQGGADLNSYKMFLEVGHTLLRAGGQLGLIVPSGLYTDNGTRALRQLLLEHNTWRYLYGFENRNKLFDIDSRFKFCVVVAQKGGKTGAVQAAFMRQELEDWEQGRALMEYPTVQIHKLSPSSLSITELRSQEDLHLMEKIQSAGIALGEVLEFTQQFDMTGDSKLFPDLHAWELKKYARNQYDVWRDGSSSVALPVYEGRMIGQFDPSEKRWVSGKGRTAVWEPVPWVSKVLGPQYLMANTDYLKSDKVVSG